MTKKISQLPAATSVDTNDEFVINQDGTTKKLTTANQWDFANVNIDGGTIDGTAIGGGTASSGAFTTLSSTSTTTLNGTTIPASKTLVDTNSTQTIDDKRLTGTTVINQTSVRAGVGNYNQASIGMGPSSFGMYFSVDIFAGQSVASPTIPDSILLYNPTYPGGTSASSTRSPCIRFESFEGGSRRSARIFERNGDLRARNYLGTETVLSPHNFELIPDGPSEDLAFSFNSINADGRQINIDMLKMVRLVEGLTGETLVYTDTTQPSVIEDPTLPPKENKADAE